MTSSGTTSHLRVTAPQNPFSSLRITWHSRITPLCSLPPSDPPLRIATTPHGIPAGSQADGSKLLVCSLEKGGFGPFLDRARHSGTGAPGNATTYPYEANKSERTSCVRPVLCSRLVVADGGWVLVPDFQCRRLSLQAPLQDLLSLLRDFVVVARTPDCWSWWRSASLVSIAANIFLLARESVDLRRF